MWGGPHDLRGRGLRDPRLDRDPRRDRHAGGEVDRAPCRRYELRIFFFSSRNSAAVSTPFFFSSPSFSRRSSLARRDALVRAELAHRGADSAPGLLPRLPRPQAHVADPVAALGVRELTSRRASQLLDAGAASAIRSSVRTSWRVPVGGQDQDEQCHRREHGPDDPGPLSQGRGECLVDADCPVVRRGDVRRDHEEDPVDDHAGGDAVEQRRADSQACCAERGRPGSASESTKGPSGWLAQCPEPGRDQPQAVAEDDDPVTTLAEPHRQDEKR